MGPELRAAGPFSLDFRQEPAIWINPEVGGSSAVPPNRGQHAHPLHCSEFHPFKSTKKFKIHYEMGHSTLHASHFSFFMPV